MKLETYTEFQTIYKGLQYWVRNKLENDFRNINTHIGLTGFHQDAKIIQQGKRKSFQQI